MSQFACCPTKGGATGAGQQAGNAVVNHFRKESLRELKKIEEAWPGLNYGLARGVLIAEPSAPSVPSLTQ